tara:strand:+ start:196 stop:348 length:153 start_codon:yes stop_codon:yes gene_type:complete
MTDTEQQMYGRCLHCETQAENQRFFVQYFQPDLALDYSEQRRGVTEILTA